MVVHAQILPDLDGAEPRRSELRLDSPHDGSVRKLGTTAVAAKLINISSRGFMAEIDGEIEAGSRVWLTVTGLPRTNAMIVWTKGDRIGGEFATPVDPIHVLEAIGRGSGSGRG